MDDADPDRACHFFRTRACVRGCRRAGLCRWSEDKIAEQKAFISETSARARLSESDRAHSFGNPPV
jgi:hypothetical protein